MIVFAEWLVQIVSVHVPHIVRYHILFIHSVVNYALCSDIEKIQSGIGDKVALFLQYSSTFISGFVIGYATNWRLALVVSVMLPILTVMAALIAKVRFE